MYCPKCGQEQISDNARFCSCCGFQLGGIVELLTNESVLQNFESKSHEKSSLYRQMISQPGVKLVFFSVVMLPLIFASSYYFDSPMPFTIPLLIFFLGLSQTAYAYLFGEKNEFENSKALSRGSSSSDVNSNIDFLMNKLDKELQQKDGFSPLVIEGLMLELIAETGRYYVKVSERLRPQWLKEVEDLLQNQFSDQLTLTEIARSANVHPTHLARVFRQYHHCTVGEYVRKLRVEHSCHKLISTEAPLIDIALEAGFYDQSHFSRCFKQITGLTPTEYRTVHQPATR